MKKFIFLFLFFLFGGWNNVYGANYSINNANSGNGVIYDSQYNGSDLIYFTVESISGYGDQKYPRFRFYTLTGGLIYTYSLPSPNYSYLCDSEIVVRNITNIIGTGRYLIETQCVGPLKKTIGVLTVDIQPSEVIANKYVFDVKDLPSTFNASYYIKKINNIVYFCYFSGMCFDPITKTDYSDPDYSIGLKTDTNNIAELVYKDFILMAKSYINDINFYGVNSISGLMVEAGSFSDTLFTDSRIYITDVSTSINGYIKAFISKLGENKTYTLQVDLINFETSLGDEINEFLIAKDSLNYVFYNMLGLDNVKSNKIFVWAGLWKYNGINYIAYYDTVLGGWYFLDESYSIYSQEQILENFENIGIPENPVDDFCSIFDVNCDGEVGILNGEFLVGLGKWLYSPVAYMSGYIKKIKEFIGSFQDIFTTEERTIGFFNLIPKTEANFNPLNNLPSQDDKNIMTDILKFGKGFVVLIFLVLALVVFIKLNKKNE